ncbi:YqeG family HAD IIIA-type phosphatase [Konateibacter massiliensis]|uniref:YqeG family HAD IIIA-type phosphatase n=1 Tax=Konateibacter massiliensis TaxID=2002841 RepID=UPI000C14E9AC|nr:YqeG family HAD IIIA-type phosphatase [Konateibacter massiliensis]
MLKRFYPSEYVNSSYVINYEELYQAGYRGILFDIDNTLVSHGAKADDKAIELITCLKNIGFRVCLISNNKEERVRTFNDEVHVKYIYNAHKPSRSGYHKAMDTIGTNKDNTIFIGDQIFTDVFGANRAGLKTILVKPIHPKEEIQIVLKRYLEKIVLFFYMKGQKKKP